MIGHQPRGPMSVQAIPSSSNHFIPFMTESRIPTREEIKQQLKSQLEYYFSRENLISDRYLKCQMDSEQFVPISVVAGFPKISKLTNDVDFIVEALKESSNVELDEKFEKVRAITKRTTIIIREVPEEFREEVEKLLDGGPPFEELKYGSNDSWYVTYEDELKTQCAYVAVQNRKNEITGRPVCARIKAGGPPTVLPPAESTNTENCRLIASSNGEKKTIQIADAGQTLGIGEIGLIPVATYQAGEPIVSHYMTPTCHFTVDSYGYNTAIQPPQPVPSSQQHQYYYQPAVPTIPKNSDELSTTSSTNSVNTSVSNYNNRHSNPRHSGGEHHSNQYYESRSSFSNSNEWRSRGGNGGVSGRFQSNHNPSETNRQNSGRGNWRGGVRNGSNTNGFNHQYNQNSHQSNWKNDQQSSWKNERQNEQQRWKNERQNDQQSWKTERQNGHHSNLKNERSNDQNSWRNDRQRGQQTGWKAERQNEQLNDWKYERQNEQQSSWKNEQNGHSTKHWRSQNDEKVPRERASFSNSHYDRTQRSESSASSISSQHHSVGPIEVPINSFSSTPPPAHPSDESNQYSAPTPTDLPSPPVWPAPSFDKRRKSSEASSATVTTSTTSNTMTPPTPVTPSDLQSVFSPDLTVAMVQELHVNEKLADKEEENENNSASPPQPPKMLPKVVTILHTENVCSPPAPRITSPPRNVTTNSFAFEETAFPSLPKKVEPVKPPQKPTFSSVAAGRLVKQIKQMPPEKKTSYAEKLKQRESFLRK